MDSVSAPFTTCSEVLRINYPVETARAILKDPLPPRGTWTDEDLRRRRGRKCPPAAAAAGGGQEEGPTQQQRSLVRRDPESAHLRKAETSFSVSRRRRRLRSHTHTHTHTYLLRSNQPLFSLFYLAWQCRISTATLLATEARGMERPPSY